MTHTEITWVIESAAKYGFGGIVAGLVIYALIKQYLGGYLPEKGKNLATREDIQKITHLVKEVEHQYNVLIKQMEARQQLRMAAMDKRLQVHQEAFTLWRELLSSEDNNQETPTIIKCQDWWEKNCLYLEPEVRNAFVRAYQGYAQRRALITARVPASEITEVWKQVTDFPKILFETVKLPGLSQAEAEVIMPEKHLPTQ